jgi:hypothetical protein
VLCQLSYSHQNLLIITRWKQREWIRDVLHSANANVFKTHGAQASGVENVFGIYDKGAAEEGFDFAEIESAKFRPTGTDHERFHAFSHRICRFAIMHGAIQFQLGVLHGKGIVSAYPSAAGNQALRQFDGSRAGD